MIKKEKSGDKKKTSLLNISEFPSHEEFQESMATIGKKCIQEAVARLLTSDMKGGNMTTQAERQKACRQRKRARGLKDRLYFTTDDQDAAIREFLETGAFLGEGVWIPEQWIRDKDRMEAIRERIARAEKHYRAKDGSELTFFGLLARLSDERVKVSKDDDRKIQDLVMLQARKAGVV